MCNLSAGPGTSPAGLPSDPGADPECTLALGVSFLPLGGFHIHLCGGACPASGPLESLRSTRHWPRSSTPFEVRTERRGVLRKSDRNRPPDRCAPPTGTAVPIAGRVPGSAPPKPETSFVGVPAVPSKSEFQPSWPTPGPELSTASQTPGSTLAGPDPRPAGRRSCRSAVDGRGPIRRPILRISNQSPK